MSMIPGGAGSPSQFPDGIGGTGGTGVLQVPTAGVAGPANTPAVFPYGIVGANAGDVDALNTGGYSITKPVTTFTTTALIASRTVTLPTTNVKAGQTFLVHVPNNSVSSVYVIAIVSSGGNSVVDLTQGYAIVKAEIDSPTTAAHWSVLDVSDSIEYTATIQHGTAVGAANGNSSGTIKLYKHNRMVVMKSVIAAYPTTGAGGATTLATTTALTASPARFRPTVLQQFIGIVRFTFNNTVSKEAGYAAALVDGTFQFNAKMDQTEVGTTNVTASGPTNPQGVYMIGF